MRLNPSKFLLNDLLQDIKAFFDKDISVKSKDLKIVLKPGLPDENSIIEIDKTRLKQVLVNLVKNACKFTDKGYVEIGYHQQESDIVLYVKDSGVGMEQEQSEFVFKRFMQVATKVSHNEEGVGLGLTISKAIINQFNGDIWVESEPGQGSIFYFNLPLKSGESGLLQSEYQKSTNMDYNWKDKLILVAEDVPTNFLLVKKSLRKTDVQLLWAKNGKETVDLVAENKNINLVLMDIRMPIMNGLDATKEIKELRPELPIIAQTAYTSTDDRQKALSAGCDEFITKPISEKTLNEMVSKYVITK